MSARHIPNKNYLLTALPTEAFERTSLHLELISKQADEDLRELFDQLLHICSPILEVRSERRNPWQPN